MFSNSAVAKVNRTRGHSHLPAVKLRETQLEIPLHHSYDYTLTEGGTLIRPRVGVDIARAPNTLGAVTIIVTASRALVNSERELT